MFINNKYLHRLLGVFLFVPIVTWSITGLVFLTKPGYEGAYERLAIKTYPLQQQAFVIDESLLWDEVRLVKTILGYHLLVRKENNYSHRHLDTKQHYSMPSEQDIARLVSDAISQNFDRYGVVESVSEDTIYTSSGIKITLNWQQLSLKQEGRDRRLIDKLYRAHYLQWTPWKTVNIAFAWFVLFSLAMLTVLGMVMYIKSRNKENIGQ